MLVGVPLLHVFNRMGCGGIVLSVTGRILAINNNAWLMLKQVLELEENDASHLIGSGRKIVKQLLGLGKTKILRDSENWILIERSGRRPLIMNFIPVPILSEDGPHSVLLLIDLGSTPQLKASCLEQIFCLTPAESRLTLKLFDGKTLKEAAKHLQVSETTVRAQLKSVFEKTHTHRQSELLALVSHLAALS